MREKTEIFFKKKGSNNFFFFFYKMYEYDEHTDTPSDDVNESYFIRKFKFFLFKMKNKLIFCIDFILFLPKLIFNSYNSLTLSSYHKKKVRKRK